MKDEIHHTRYHVNAAKSLDSALKVGQYYGYILYRSNLGEGRKLENFRLLGAADRAKVYVNENHVLTQYDKELGNRATTITLHSCSAVKAWQK